MGALCATFLIGTPCAFAATQISAGDDSAVPQEILARANASEGTLEVAGELAPQETPSDWYNSPSLEDGVSVYTISNGDEFRVFSQIVNGTHPSIAQDSFEGDIVRIDEVIALKLPSAPDDPGEFAPIGGGTYSFDGTFDGADKDIWLIGDFTITSPRNTQVGLFGKVGATGCLKNVKLNNARVSVTVEQAGTTVTADEIIDGVGALVGVCEGSIENCEATNSVSVTISSNANGDVSISPAVVRNIGGLAGTCDGDVSGCSFAGRIAVSVTGAPAEYEGDDNIITSLTENIGGIVGKAGGEAILDEGTATERYNVGHGNITNCTNSGSIELTSTGKYWSERWVEWVTAQICNVGGIVGYSIGNITGCSNSGSIDPYTTSNIPVGDAVGGIVGALRSTAIAGQSSDKLDDGMYGRSEGEPKDTQSDELILADCVNTGIVEAFHGPGGIAGVTGTYTTTTRCSNSGSHVWAWRWNKPSPGGIVGQTYGYVTYCYNRAEVATKGLNEGKVVFGSGYYAGGIVGMLTVAQRNNERVSPDPAIISCYNIGMIRASGNFRQGAIVGGSDGLVKYCAYLENCVPVAESGGRDIVTGGKEENDGTEVENYGYEAEQLKTGVVPPVAAGDAYVPSAIALLNSSAAAEEAWATYFVTSPNEEVNGGYPVFSTADGRTDDDRTSLLSGTLHIALAENAIYSPACAAAPKLDVTLNGEPLIQNVDYKVLTQAGSTQASAPNTTPYTATIEGIGAYRDASNDASAPAASTQTIDYGIDKADLGSETYTCLVTTTSRVFNWEEQSPETVTVFDSAGNVIPSSEYTWEKYVADDYNNSRKTPFVNAGKWDIKVTAKAESPNYQGSVIGEEAFMIIRAPLYSNGDMLTSANLISVIYDGDVRTWNDGKLENQDYVYNGTPVKPVVNELTYLDRSLVLGRDFIQVYDNYNPESSSNSGSAEYIDVTEADKPAVLTVRYKGGGDFQNWTNVLYNIVPADISEESQVLIDAPAVLFSGAGESFITVKTSKGIELTQGYDYTVDVQCDATAGTAAITIAALTKADEGSGNLTGERVITVDLVAENDVVELGGSSRYDTIALEALYAYPEGANGVIIAGGDAWPDALAATSLAGALDYPILITTPDTLSPQTLDAIEKLENVSEILIVGGEGVVGPAVASQLTSIAGVTNVERLSGDSRYDTARKIYDYGVRNNLWDGEYLILATGGNFPDSLSISPVAASKAAPILLVLNSEIRATDKEAIAGKFENVLVAGGEGVVSEAALAWAAANTKSGAVDSAVRLSGQSRYETSLAIADYAVEQGWLGWNGVAFASATVAVDALGGSVLQGLTGSVLMLASDVAGGYANVAALSDHKGDITTIRFFGGTGAVSQDLRNRANTALGW